MVTCVSDVHRPACPCEKLPGIFTDISPHFTDSLKGSANLLYRRRLA